MRLEKTFPSESAVIFYDKIINSIWATKEYINPHLYHALEESKDDYFFVKTKKEAEPIEINNSKCKYKRKIKEIPDLRPSLTIRCS